MAEIPKDIQSLLFGRGAKWHSRVSMALFSLGLIFTILGIIGDATNRTIGLEPENWLLLAVVHGVFAFAAWVCAYIAAKEGYTP